MNTGVSFILKTWLKCGLLLLQQFYTYTMYIDHINPQFLPHPDPTSTYSSYLLVIFFLNPLSPISPHCMSIGNLPDATHLEKSDPPHTLKPSFANSFSARGRNACQCWNLAWLGLVYRFWACICNYCEFLYADALVCSEDTGSLQLVIHYLWGHQLFLPPPP